ncbi:MAG: CBS domain-containing protein [Alphaproteobacteria bacterium]|nr:CBS domain-containing protein [Alphaproteobacteria bacterium]
MDRLPPARQEAPHHDILTDSEIEGLVEVSAEHGKMGSGQAGYIHNVFRFGEMDISDVMVHRTEMFTINAEDPPTEIMSAVHKAGYTRVPLWREMPDNIVGVLHVNNLAQALLEKGELGKVDIAVLASEPWFVPDTTSLEEQFKAFRARRTHMALVVDEYGALMGLITPGDILSEILGELPDENRIPSRPLVRARPDGSYLVDGTVPVRDLNRDLGWSLPEDDATTIAGLVISQSGTIPDVGQRFAFFGFIFEIMRRQRNQIIAVRVIPAVNASAPRKA